MLLAIQGFSSGDITLIVMLLTLFVTIVRKFTHLEISVKGHGRTIKELKIATEDHSERISRLEGIPVPRPRPTL